MTDTQWVQFSAQGFKRKRAELACAFCHSKKIRCDVQVKRHQGLDSCTNCSSAGRDCRTRPSKRGDKTRRTGDNLPQPPTPPTDNTTNDPIDHSLLDTTGASSNNSNASQGHHSDARRNTGQSLQNFAPTVRPSFDKSASQWPLDPAITISNDHQVEHSSDADVLSRPPENWIVEQPGQNFVAHDILQISSAQIPSPLQSSSAKKLDPFKADLRQSFAETYFEYCYCWCPVLDRKKILDELAESPLLDDALAIAGSHIRPPLIPHPGPVEYYNRARRRFYDDEEEDLMKSLKAVLLFYWWAPRSTSTVHKHSSWWWTSVVIKHGQQAGFHHESALDQSQANMDRCFKRRVWWTAFARERLTAICQGKPCLIDPDDCNIPEPSLADFPDTEDRTKAEIFIYWVRLCSIIGRIAKELSRSANNAPAKKFPECLGRDLTHWIQSLPLHLQLPIRSSHTPNFNLDVHQLHLPYLAVIVILHLTRSSQSMPQALPPATLAASCIARILKDILLRSATRYVMPITCWYTAMAFTTLLQASRAEHLRDGATAQLEILVLAIKELSKMWATGKLLEQQFERLMEHNKPLTPEDFPSTHLGNDRSTRALHSEEEVLQSGIDWLDYFPFVTAQTSAVAEKLLAPQNMDEFFWDESSMLNCQDFLQGFDIWTDSNVLG